MSKKEEDVTVAARLLALFKLPNNLIITEPTVWEGTQADVYY